MGTTLLASGQGLLSSPSDEGNASTFISNSTLPWCYVVNVNETDATNSISSPPGISLTSTSIPSARFGQTNGTNTTTVLFNSTILCADPLATPSPSRTPKSGLAPRANLQALDISVTTTTSAVSITSLSSSRPTSPGPSSPLVTSSILVSSTTSSESSPTTSGVLTSTGAVSPVTPAAPSSATITVSNSPSSVSPSPPTSSSVTGSSTQGAPASTLTAIPDSTFSTPISTETTDNHATITIPPFVSTTGLSTLPSRSTSVIANPPNQDVSGSKGDSFFGNRAAVIGVFVSSGFTFAGLVLLAFYCLRRRQRRARRRGSQLLESPQHRPTWNPFANVTGNPTMGERAGPNIRWYRSLLPRDPASMPQSLFSVPLNRSEDSLVQAHGGPVPPPTAQRAPSRSSHRVLVPYTGIGGHDDNMWVENRRSIGPTSEHLQIQSTPSSNGPPLLPVLSPTRPLEVHNTARYSREKTLSLSISRASSPSVYPPSPHRSDVDSLYQQEVVANLPPKQESPRWLTRGLSYGIKPSEGRNVVQADENAESQQGAHINPDDSRGVMSLDVSVSSSSNAHFSPLESPVSETGTALTSIQDVNSPSRKAGLPLAPPTSLFTPRKSGARLRRDF